MQHTKLAYEAPRLKDWGSVADLTQVGNTHPDTDCFGGSVFPPGHDGGCPPGVGPS